MFWNCEQKFETAFFLNPELFLNLITNFESKDIFWISEQNIWKFRTSLKKKLQKRKRKREDPKKKKKMDRSMSYLPQQLNSLVFHEMKNFFIRSSCRAELWVWSLIEVANLQLSLKIMLARKYVNSFTSVQAGRNVTKGSLLKCVIRTISVQARKNKKKQSILQKWVILYIKQQLKSTKHFKE